MSRSNFGTIQYVSKGKYRVWWEDGRSTTGKRKRASKVVNGTMDDAELYLAKIRVGLVGCTEDMTYDELWAGKVSPRSSATDLPRRPWRTTSASGRASSGRA